MSNVDELLSFIKESPVAINALDTIRKVLLNNGLVELDESKPFNLERGKGYFVIRNNTSVIAFKVGENVTREYGYHIIASHSDSPCFKLKPNAESKTDIYNKINVEPYGGMLCSTWLDRPLSVAGRVFVNDNGHVAVRNIIVDKDLLMIPNMCIHFNRNANSGYAYNMATDMQAFIGQELEGEPLKELLCKELNVNKEDIINFDLYLYNHERTFTWGINNEYVSAPRLDDLECAFTSLKAFINSNNDENVNVLAIFDNEEVGSLTRQGADSNFFDVTLNRINSSLGFTQEDLTCALSSSMLISADNAHAVHPNNPSMTDSNNKVYMNKGIAIKFNAAQSYTSDGLSSSLFQEICKQAEVPYQFYTNRSDIRGGSTLGNLSASHVSLISVDIGLPQLAMHSSFETAGSKDVDYAIKAFTKFYNCTIKKENGVYLVK